MNSRRTCAPLWPLRPGPESPVRDDFDAAGLHPRWVSLLHRSEVDCSTNERPGWLSLRAGGGSLDGLDVTFVGRRQQHPSCRVRTLVDASDGRGGLVVRMDERHHYEVEVTDGQARALARIGPLCTVLATVLVPTGPLVLRVEATEEPRKDARSAPDTVSLGVEEPDGTFTVLAALDGRYLSTEVAGGFTGRVIGMYATAGTVRFDWYDYEQMSGSFKTGAGGAA